MSDIAPSRIFNRVAKAPDGPPAPQIDAVAILHQLTDPSPDVTGSRARMRAAYGWRVGAP